MAEQKLSVVESWTTKEWKDNLSRRLKACKRHRARFDEEMKAAAAIVYNQAADYSPLTPTFDTRFELDMGDVDEGDSHVRSNYTFKYVRFRHGQYSANPPSVIARPSSTDPTDREKADAADRVVRHGYQDKSAQELFDSALLKGLVRGSGWLKLVWDKDCGDVHDFNNETKEIEMDGDHRAYSPATLDMWVDPVAKCWADARYTFECHRMPLAEAVFKWPHAKDELKKSLNKGKDALEASDAGEDMVEIYEYYEKGLPLNGMAGRHAFCLEDGTTLGTPGANPHWRALLPYHLFTDVDVEDQVYGKSTVSYVARKQELLDRFDSAVVDAMNAHACVRMAVSDQTELNDDDISDSNYEIIKYSGQVPPTFIQPPTLPPDLGRLRMDIKTDIQELMGVNDAQLGVQKRETSGFSQQTAIEAGNIVNRRGFNKYTSMVKSFWQHYLGLCVKHWSEERTILVLGKEKAFEAIQLKGADIAGGFDIVVEYGASLPIDPNMRREQLMLLMEPLQKAGVPMTRILQLLKLNELDTLYDELEQAADRQMEIFKEMIALHKKGLDAYIEPEELENHEAMLIFCSKYRMSMEYKTLPEEVKPLIEKHIKDRMQLAAQVKGQGTAGAPVPGPQAAPASGPVPLPVPPPAPADLGT